MIDVSELLNDPDLCEPFIAQRQTGTWVAGRFVPQPTPVQLYGVVQVADARMLEQVPEGDRKSGAMVFWSTSEMYETRDGDDEGLSDLLIHKGLSYRVSRVWDWSANGYFKALATRIKGS